MNHSVRTLDDGSLPKPGDMVAGKYRIDSVIGAGGMGVVMGAFDLSLGRPAAIKFLSPAKAKRDGAVHRFVREARAAASIQSEHVVRVFEVGTLPTGSPFIVMEQLRGQDLSQVLAGRGALPIMEAADLVLQVCEALGEAHTRGIVHRDLKPQNLFLTHRADGSPCVKVLDFGISKAIDDGPQNLTSTDMVMGTPLYMSPEQVRSLKNVDQRADIWALGSILFELLTMSPIFTAPSATALCAMIAMDPPTPLRARRPDAPVALEDVILRCLHKDPAGRFQDVGALSAALAPFATERGRLSATRISRVVQGGSAPDVAALAGSAPTHVAPFGPGTGPGSGPRGETTIDGAGRVSHSYGPPPYGPSQPPLAIGPSGRPPAPGFSAPPPMPPNTQSTWQQTHTGDLTRDGRKGTSPVLVALFGVLTGFVVLIVIGGAGYYFYSKKGAPETVAAVDASPPAAAVTAPAANPTVIPSAVETAKPDAGSAKPSARKDAGAPGVPKPPVVDDDLEGKRRMHQSFCGHNRMLLTSNPSEATLKNIKTSSCLPGNGPDAARCERDNCRMACSMLKDQDCLRQMDYADSQMPTKY